MELIEVKARARRLCAAYNQELATSFERLSEGHDEQLFDRSDFVERLQRECLNAAGAWFARYDEELGFVPETFIDALQTKEEYLAVYDICALSCDGFLPETFQIALGRQRAELLAAIYERALACALDCEESVDGEALQIQCISLELLGQWSDGDFAPILLEQMLSSALLNERLATAIQAYFKSCGRSALAALKEALGRALSAPEFSPNVDYLLIYLIEASRTEADGEVYPLLRRAFKQMDEKIIPIICLGDCGDKRAVPLLRSFLERNMGHLDRQILLETFSSIQRLGGLTDDLKALLKQN